MTDNTRFKLKLFGGFRLLDDRGNLIDPGPRKVKAMIAWLAIHADTKYPREKVAALFWPDAQTESARHSLRQALGSLRKAIGNEISPVRISKETLSFDSSRAEVDALLFDEALSRGEILASETISELYQGDLLLGCNPRSDLFDEWLIQQRNHYRERATNALCQRLTQLIDTRKFEAALPIGMRLVNIDNLRESAYRGIMLAHMGLGNHALALRWYHRCERTLIRELNVRPCLETRALHAQLLSGRQEVIESGRQHQAELTRKKNTLRQVSKGHQRVLYQLASALEAIEDQLGGQTVLLRAEDSQKHHELLEQAISLAELQGFAICGGEVASSSGAELEGVEVQSLTVRMAQCLEGAFSTPVTTSGSDKTFDLAVEALKARAAARPILMIVENVHGAGGRCLELLGRLISEVGSASILLLMTMRHRPGFPYGQWQGAMLNSPLTTFDLA